MIIRGHRQLQFTIWKGYIIRLQPILLFRPSSSSSPERDTHPPSLCRLRACFTVPLFSRILGQRGSSVTMQLDFVEEFFRNRNCIANLPTAIDNLVTRTSISPTGSACTCFSECAALFSASELPHTANVTAHDSHKQIWPQAQLQDLRRQRCIVCTSGASEPATLEANAVSGQSGNTKQYSDCFPAHPGHAIPALA